jgi:phosphatidate cytidylyltransferase
MGGLEKKKVWTGILIVPPLVLLIAWGSSLVFFLIVLAATLLGLREFFSLTLTHAKWIERTLATGLGLFLVALVSFGDVHLLAPYFVFLILFLSVLFMATSKNLLSAISDMGVTLLGILYVPFLLAHIPLIRSMADGKQWTLFLIVTVWTGDVAAFMSGSLWGRHKLYPKISPNKTFEGLAGAILGSLLMALIFSRLFIPDLKKGPCVLLAIGLGILGQLGDFTESMVKRSAQVKDSGSLIPGHGGMLDRLDSFFFAAPFLYYSLLYFFKESP